MLSIVNKSINQTIQRLFEFYPDAKCRLIYNTPWQLLLATILSAQTRDEYVNKVTAVLFTQYPTLKAIAYAQQTDIEKIIYSTGMYRTKAKNIINASKYLLDNHNGKVPSTMENLIKIPGVARKTANVVLTEYFKKGYGIVVDTHVIRISRRLGWTKEVDATKIEFDLMKKVHKKYWRRFTNVMIAHGRTLCTAKNPKCKDCPVKNVCLYYAAFYTAIKR